MARFLAIFATLLVLGGILPTVVDADDQTPGRPTGDDSVPPFFPPPLGPPPPESLPVGGTAADSGITLSLAGPAFDQTSIAPPPSSPLSNEIIKRDCGFSVELTGGDALWIFCDSVDHDEDRVFSYFWNSTAAYGLAGDPLTMREATDSKDRPYRFIDPVSSYDPCVGEYAGQRHIIWPVSAVVVPTFGGRDRVIVYFQNLCYVKGSGTLVAFTPISMGVAEFISDPADPTPGSDPIKATTLNPNLWSIDNSDPAGPFGEAVIADSFGFVYVYRCGTNWGCQVGRVPRNEVQQAASYRYWDGDSWESQPPAGGAIDINPADALPGSFNIVYLDDWDLYAMAGMVPEAYAETVNIMVSPSIMGPWSSPVPVPNPVDCDNPSGCYDGFIHSQLSTPDTLGLTVFDWQHYFYRAGQVRAFSARVDVDPAPNGLCFSGFVDVAWSHAFCSEIAWFAQQGITTGWPDGTYRPSRNVSRQAMAAWFYRWAGSPPGPFSDPGFSDVNPGDPFYAEIAWFAQQSITTGYPDGRYRPTIPVTRQAVAAWFYRWEGREPGPFPDPGFSDVAPGAPFYTEIAWFARQGITTGYSDGTFRPGITVRRQAVAAYFARYAGAA